MEVYDDTDREPNYEPTTEEMRLKLERFEFLKCNKHLSKGVHALESMLERDRLNCEIFQDMAKWREQCSSV